LPILAVLGLSEHTDTEWIRIRGLQYASLAQGTTARLLTHGLAGIATAMLLIGDIPLVAIGVWAILLGASLHFIAKVDRSLVDADRRRMSIVEVKRQSMSSIANAMVWVIPIAAASVVSDPDMTVQLKLWTVLAMLMTASAILIPAVPMSTILLTLIIGGAAIAQFLLNKAFDMAAVSFAFVAIILIGTIESARRYVLTKSAEAEMVERNEVVSLLLREFEEGEADWLWQIDTSRRARSVSPRFAFALGRDAKAAEGVSIIELIAGTAWESASFLPVSTIWRNG